MSVNTNRRDTAGPGSSPETPGGEDARRTVVLHTRVLADRGGGPEKTILAGPAFFASTPYRLVAAYIHPYACPGFEELAVAARRSGCEMVGVPERGPLDPRTIFALLRVCRRFDVAVWHGHDYKSNLLGLVLRRFHPMRLVTTLHGWIDLSLRTRLYFAIERRCLRAYERVFCVSTDLAEMAQRCGVAPERVSMLRNGVDVTVYRRGSPQSSAPFRRALGVPESRRIIGVVGRLAPSKGLDLILDAFANLGREHGDAELWLAGEGPARGPLERRAVSLGIAERVRFLGYRDDVRPVLEACDVVVSASWREGTPNALLEAMAMEVAVVATDVGGVAALVRDGETGILFDSGDAAALTAAIERLLADTNLRARLVRAARELVQSEFSLAERMRIEAAAYDVLLQ